MEWRGKLRSVEQTGVEKVRSIVSSHPTLPISWYKYAVFNANVVGFVAQRRVSSTCPIPCGVRGVLMYAGASTTMTRNDGDNGVRGMIVVIVVAVVASAAVKAVTLGPPGVVISAEAAVAAVAAASPIVVVTAGINGHPIVVTPLTITEPEAPPSAAASINHVSATITTAIFMTHLPPPVSALRVITFSTRRPFS